MGFYDTVTFEEKHEPSGVAGGTVFQTKSLGRGEGQFKISGQGELVMEECLYEKAAASGADAPFRLKRVVVGAVAVPYHGDMLLIAATDHKPDQVVARFTDGKLEWARPVASYPERWLQLLWDIGSG